MSNLVSQIEAGTYDADLAKIQAAVEKRISQLQIGRAHV